MPNLHPIECLTSGQYNAIMTAINNYRAELLEKGLTQAPDMVLEGNEASAIIADLDAVEHIIMTSNVPY
jgi:hypothetical protein